MKDEKVLVVVDISSMIYAGARKDYCRIKGEMIQTVNGWKENDVPCGGVAYLFNLIHEKLGECDFVFCGDRTPSIKLGMYPTYKKDRFYSGDRESIERQKEIAELILKDCGFPVIARDGYEADDIIYSICKVYKHEYDKIYVYVNDADLYIVVDDNVEIMPPARNGKHITKENYDRTCYKNELVPYNTVTFFKFLYGCKSDNVGPLQPASLAEAIKQKFYQPQNYELLGVKERLRSFVEIFFPQALTQFDVIYPLDVDVTVHHTEWDYTRIKVWADKIDCFAFKDVNVNEVNYEIEEERISEIIKDEIL